MEAATGRVAVVGFVINGRVGLGGDGLDAEAGSGRRWWIDVAFTRSSESTFCARVKVDRG